MCIFGALSSNFPIVEYLNAVTGWDFAADDYLLIGERILNIRKAFNIREGLTSENFKANARAMGNPPLQAGPLKGVSINIDKLEKQFFKIVGWSSPSGGPTPGKMKELGIDSLEGRIPAV